MRRRLLLVPAVLLSLAVIGCQKSNGGTRTQATESNLARDVQIWADSMEVYVQDVANAACAAAKQAKLDAPSIKKLCGATALEVQPVPKYPPR